MGDLVAKEDLQYCNEACLIRYLRAREWNLDKSEKMLRATLEWRREYKPHEIDPNPLSASGLSGKLFINGKDKEGRPLVFMIPRNENSKDYENNVKYLVYILERAVDQMEDGVEQMVLMMDFKGFAKGNSVPLSVCKEVITILSNHYPERLGIGLMVDTPWLFSLFWRAISPFLNPVTASKVKFVSSKDGALLDYVDKQVLDVAYGGEQSSFSIKSFWDSELKRYERHLAKHSHSRSNSGSLSVHSLKRTNSNLSSHSRSHSYSSFSAEELD